MEPREKRNEEGLNILEEVRGLRATMALDPLDMITIRAVALDEWIGKTRDDRDTILQRNVAAQSGRITADVTTIQAYSEIPDMENRFEDAEKKEIPEELKHVLDRRASVCVLNIWQRACNTEKRERILQNEDSIIEHWSTDSSKDLFVDESHVSELYKEICRDWISGYPAKK